MSNDEVNEYKAYVDQKFSDLFARLDGMQQSIDRLNTAIAGDNYGNPGFDKRVKELEDKHKRNADEIERLKQRNMWYAGAIAALIATLSLGLAVGSMFL